MDHLTKTIRIMNKNNSTDTYEVVGQKLTCCSTELFIFFAEKNYLFLSFLFSLFTFLISARFDFAVLEFKFAKRHWFFFLPSQQPSFSPW